MGEIEGDDRERVRPRIHDQGVGAGAQAHPGVFLRAHSMKTAGTMFMSALLREANNAIHLGHGSIGHLFTKLETPGYEYIKEFSKNYGGLPSPQTFEDAIQIDLPEAPEPSAYYLDRLRSRFTHDTLLEGMQSAQTILGGSHDEQKALETIAEVMLQLIAAQHIA